MAPGDFSFTNRRCHAPESDSEPKTRELGNAFHSITRALAHMQDVMWSFNLKMEIWDYAMRGLTEKLDMYDQKVQMLQTRFRNFEPRLVNSRESGCQYASWHGGGIEKEGGWGGLTLPGFGGALTHGSALGNYAGIGANVVGGCANDCGTTCGRNSELHTISEQEFISRETLEQEKTTHLNLSRKELTINHQPENSAMDSSKRMPSKIPSLATESTELVRIVKRPSLRFTHISEEPYSTEKNSLNSSSTPMKSSTSRTPPILGESQDSHTLRRKSQSKTSCKCTCKETYNPPARMAASHSDMQCPGPELCPNIGRFKRRIAKSDSIITNQCAGPCGFNEEDFSSNETRDQKKTSYHESLQSLPRKKSTSNERTQNSIVISSKRTLSKRSLTSTVSAELPSIAKKAPPTATLRPEELDSTERNSHEGSTPMKNPTPRVLLAKKSQEPLSVRRNSKPKTPCKCPRKVPLTCEPPARPNAYHFKMQPRPSHPPPRTFSIGCTACFTPATPPIFCCKEHQAQQKIILGRQLFAMAHAGEAPEVWRLLDEGADVNFPNSSKWTPLHRAAVRAHADVVEVLLVRGADADARTAFGYTPLHLAARNDRTGRCVKHLLDAGVQMDCWDRSGKSPLHLACESGNAVAVEQLLRAGASVNAVDDAGNTAYDVAKADAIRRLFLAKSR